MNEKKKKKTDELVSSISGENTPPPSPPRPDKDNALLGVYRVSFLTTFICIDSHTHAHSHSLSQDVH